MIYGIYVLTGKIELQSPALIGSGNAERSDMDLLLDADGKPFIPASSFVGVLRHMVKDKNLNLSSISDSHSQTRFKEDLMRFWGFAYLSEKEKEELPDKEGIRSSLLRCDDLFCIDEDPKVKIRDGIKIDSRTGIVEEQKKYDYEVVERGTRFNLRIEVPYFAPAENNPDDNFTYIDKNNIEIILQTIRQLLSNGEISVGAKTNNGLGKLVLRDARLYFYDFKDGDHVRKWLKGNGYPAVYSSNASPLPLSKKDRFLINAYFEVKGSVIVRSYPTDPDVQYADAVHISSKGDYILPGNSLKGAIRARAERIAKTLYYEAITQKKKSVAGETLWKEAKDKAEILLNELFGIVKENNGEVKRGKVTIEETVLPKFLIPELQRRIRIDRFTSGTIEGALFDSMPLFWDKLKAGEVIDFREKGVQLTIKLKKYKDYEAGLLLLVLKDLWTGDLAVGGEKNVGRGVFKGLGVEVIIGHNCSIEIPEDVSQISEPETLEKYVSALVKKIEETA
ncbi:RAMP superfamily CRISPR-associated protein [Calditrichota bacterium LG25]